MNSILRRRSICCLSLIIGLSTACKKKIDPDKLEGPVKAFLKKELKVKDVEVSCPEDIKLNKNATFECTAIADGHKLVITTTQLDDEGTVSWKVTDGLAAIQISAGSEKLVATLFENQLGVADVKVTCPEKIVIKKGGTFTCSADIDGVPVTALVEQQDDQANITYAFSGGILVSEKLSILIQGAMKAEKIDASVDCGKAVRLSKPGSTFECKATDGNNKTGTIAVKIKDTNGNVDWKLVDVEK